MQACCAHHRRLKTDQQARRRPRAHSGCKQAAREPTRALQYPNHSGLTGRQSGCAPAGRGLQTWGAQQAAHLNIENLSIWA